MHLSPGNGRRVRGRAPMAEINVTPFVDVMLVLLIIFMVTAPLLVAGVPVELPESRANALEQDQEPVQISIDGAGRVYVDSEQVGGEGLATSLETIAAAQTPENPRQIMLRGDKSLNWGTIMAVMGELNRVGLNKVSLITETTSAPVNTATDTANPIGTDSVTTGSSEAE